MALFAGQWGPQQFVNGAGVPMPGIAIDVYLPGTNTRATLWTDRDKEELADNPFITTTLGNGVFWTDPGVYDIEHGATRLSVLVPSDPAEDLDAGSDNTWTGINTFTDDVVINDVLGVGVSGASIAGKAHVKSGSAGVTALIVQGAVGQTADLLQARDSAGVTIASLVSTGRSLDLGLTAGNSDSSQVSLAGGRARLRYDNGVVRLDDGSPTTSKPGIVSLLGLTIQNSTGTTTPTLVTKGVTTQTADLQQWQSDAGAVLSRITATGLLGIGVNPVYPVHVSQTFTGTGATSGVGVRSTATAAPSAALTAGQTVYGSYTEAASASANSAGWLTQIGTQSIADWAGAGTIPAAYGVVGQAQSTGAGSVITNAYGVRGLAQATGAGSITNAHGVQGYVQVPSSATGTVTGAHAFLATLQNLNAGTITTASGLNVPAPTNSGGGTITNWYGVYLADSVVTGVTNSWGVYQLGAQRNYFGGKVGIGTTLDLGAQASVVSPAAATVGSITRGASGQSASLAQWQNSAGAVLMSITSGGHAIVGARTTNLPTEGTPAITPRLAVSSPTQAGRYIGLGYDDVLDAGHIAATDTGVAWKPVLINAFGGGNVGVGGNLTTAKLNVVGTAAGAPVVIARSAVTQTGDIAQWQDSAGAVLARITAAGNLGIGVDPGAFAFAATQTRTETSGTPQSHKLIQTVAPSAALTLPTTYQGLVVEQNAGSANLTTTNATLTALQSSAVHQAAGGGVQAMRGLYGIAQQQSTVAGGNVVSATGVRGDAQLSGSANVTDLRALYGFAQANGSGTVASIRGVDLLCQATVDQTGAVSAVYGATATLQNLSALTIANMYAFHGGAPTNTGGGTITNYYGLYLSDAADASTTNAWGLYVLGTQRNYLSGRTSIGSTFNVAQLAVQTDAATTVGAVIRATATQTADLLQLQNSAGGVVARIDSAGNVYSNGVRLDQDVAHLSTDEAFTGVKTFTVNPVFNDAAIPQAKVSGLVAALASLGTAVNMATQPGVVADGITNDRAALQTAINANPGKTLLFPAGVTFRGENNTYLVFTNVTVIALGSNLKNLHVQMASDVKWFGGTVDQDTGTGINSLFRVTGDRVKAEDVTVTGTSAWTAVELRDVGTARPEEVDLLNVTAKAKSGFTIFACREVTLTTCHAESTVNDDLFVLKDSLGNGCEDVTLSGCSGRNGNALLAIGSEVANGGYVRNVKLLGARGTNCAKILHIKPGGVEAVSGYTLGLVEIITAENCQLIDLLGTAMQSPIEIAPGRGAQVRGVRCRGILVRGRQKSTTTNRNFIKLTPINGLDGINGSNIADFEANDCSYIDQLGGVLNDAQNPGHPLVDGIVFGGAASNGTITNVVIRGVTIRGATGGYAAWDGATLAGEIIFDRPVMRNLRTDISSRAAFHNFPIARIIDPVVTDATSVPPASLVSATGPVNLQASGTGSPEGVVTAGVGSTWRRTDSAGAGFYFKQEGNGNTGWRGKTSVRTVSHKRTAGNYSVSAANTTSWNDLDTTTDLTFAARAGDLVTVGISARAENEAVLLCMDVASIVGGNPVNYWGATGGTGDNGIPSWIGNNGVVTGLAGEIARELVAGDISGGTVTLRIRYRMSPASTVKTLRGNTACPFYWWARVQEVA